MEPSGRNNEFAKERSIVEQGKLSEVCEVDPGETKANGICRECDKHMCFRHHLNTKSCRQHVLLREPSPSETSNGNDVTCKLHSNKLIIHYCREHKFIGCKDCMRHGHKTCQKENINEVSKEFKHSEDFKSFLKRLNMTKSAIEDNNIKIKEDIWANDNMLEKALEEIKAFRSEINNYLDRAEEIITKEAKAVQRKQNKLLAKLEQDCKLLSSNITDIEQTLNSNLCKDSKLFIQTVNCKDRLLDVDLGVIRIQKENVIKNFEFLPEKEVQDILRSAVKLGSLTYTLHTSSTSSSKATRTTGTVKRKMQGLKAGKQTCKKGKDPDPPQKLL